MDLKGIIDDIIADIISMSVSGGGFNFPFLQSAASTCIKLGYVPRYIIGVSSGALMALPLALGLHEQLYLHGINTPAKDLFKVMPQTKKEKLSFWAFLRAVTFRNSFGVQDISKVLKSLVTRQIFEYYQKGDFATVLISSVNINTGKPVVVNCKEINYECYIDHVQASSRIPVMTQPKKIGDHYYCDGGLVDHNAGHYLIENYPDIQHHISLYSRPENFEIEDMNAQRNWFTMTARTIELLNIQVSTGDQYREKIECEKRGIKLTQIFNPKRLHYYNSSTNLRRELHEIGGQRAIEALNK